MSSKLSNKLKSEILFDYSTGVHPKVLSDVYNIPENEILTLISGSQNKNQKSPGKSHTQTFSDYFDSLNESQKKAASTKSKHTLVLAGAGCGKTRTIIARAAYLIENGVKPESIQILTFTRRAANEIVERVNSLTSKEGDNINASTFHSWCISILHKYSRIFGLSDFTILDRDEQNLLFKRVRGKRDKKEIPNASQLTELYSFARNTQKTLLESVNYKAPEYKNSFKELSIIIKDYEFQKQSLRYLDYDDILEIVANGLSQYDDIRNCLCEKYKYILVDEMQDTNPLQWKLLFPFTEKSSLFCVGDDAQSIYGFRGADFQNIHSFSSRVPDSIILKLQDNYRSTQEILDLSNWLLNESPIKYEKKLHAIRGKGFKPELHSFMTFYDDDEAKWVVENIIEKCNEGNNYSDISVLVRTAISARQIEKNCLLKNIPYIFIGGTALFAAAHIKDVLSAIRVLHNHYDQLAWIRYLELFPKVGDVTASKEIDKIITFSELDDYLNSEHPAILDNSLSILKKVNNKKSSLSKTLEFIIEELSPILQENYKNSNWNARKSDFTFLIDLSKKYDTVQEFMEEYVLNPIYETEKKASITKDTLIISTIHSAKGSENKIIYVPFAGVTNYPSNRDISSEDDIEEARRVLYVALTRAKNELIISRNDNRRSYGYWVDDEDDLEDLEDIYFLKDIPKNLIKIVRHLPEEKEVFSSTDTNKNVTRKINYGINIGDE